MRAMTQTVIASSKSGHELLKPTSFTLPVGNVCPAAHHYSSSILIGAAASATMMLQYGTCIACGVKIIDHDKTKVL
jgi:hypothetical protein